MLSFPPLKFCFGLVLFIYGTWQFTAEVFSSFLPLGAITVGIMAVSIYFLRVPPPTGDVVKAVIGDDPLLIADGVDAKKKAKIVRSMAHRGCGLDAPENTLEAFNYVSEVMFALFMFGLYKDALWFWLVAYRGR